MSREDALSVITETIFISDPHAGHESGSISKMRLSIRAQLARAPLERFECQA